MAIEVENAKLIRRHFDAGEWSQNFGVCQELLDFRFRYINPITTLEGIRELLNSRPDTVQFIDMSDFLEEIPDVNQLAGETTEELQSLAIIYGAWVPPNGGPGKTKSFVNPNYIHANNMRDFRYISDDNTRLKYITRVLKHGLGDKNQLATAFGMTPEDFQQFLTQNDINWSEQRAEARQTRLARTIRTLHKWGYNRERVMTAFGLSESAQQSLLGHVESSWEPPKRPTDPGGSLERFSSDKTENEPSDSRILAGTADD